MAKQKLQPKPVIMDIPFPLEGLDITTAVMRQRPLTTAQAMNVIAFEPQTDRARGGQRPGTTVFTGFADGPVRDIALFVSQGAVAGGVLPASPGIPGTGANTITVANPGTQVSTVGSATGNIVVNYTSTGGSGWAATTQGLPAGVTMTAQNYANPGSVTFSGTPTNPQSCVVVVTITDSSGSSGSATFTWIVEAPAAIATRTQYLAFAVGSEMWVGVVGGSITSYTTVSISGTYPCVFSSPCQQQLFYCDGTHYWYFAPWASGAAKQATWTAVEGSLPTDNSSNAATLICTWNGRVVLAGIQNYPANWYMSAQLDPFNWDYSPPTQVATQAVTGNIAPAGTLGDFITSLVPYSDSILIFGLSHSIWMMNGDPINGGTITNVSPNVGMQWGRPWAIDPYGQLYFVGSDRRVYKMVPGALPVQISQAVNRDLQNVVAYDPQNAANSQCVFRLLWDNYHQGLWVFASQIMGTVATNFFYDSRTNAWWPVQFAAVSYCPFAALAANLDGAEEQTLYIGGYDSNVRTINTQGGAESVSSSVVLGPIGTKDLQTIMLRELVATLAADSGNVTWSLFVGDTAEEALTNGAVQTGTWQAGRNPAEYVRWAGIQMYIQITATSPWAIERLSAMYVPCGRVRWRGWQGF